MEEVVEEVESITKFARPWNDDEEDYVISMVNLDGMESVGQSILSFENKELLPKNSYVRIRVFGVILSLFVLLAGCVHGL